MGCISYKTDIDKFDTISNCPFKDIKVVDIDNNINKIENYIEHKKLIIIVNTASSCGYTTSNYTQLVELYNKFSKNGLQILGFPCNQFFSQENDNEAEIKKFVKNKFNVEFPMFSKLEVNGQNTHELYKYIKTNHSNFKIDEFNLKNIPWNFTKFLLDEKGKVLNFYSPESEPIQMEDEIKKYLYTD